MKKKLEADLMSIAHRVLQIKNKSDVNKLYLETQKLYEKLSVLRFVEEYFGDAKPTIGQAEIVEKMKHFFEENYLSELIPMQLEEEIDVEKIITEEIVEEEIENVLEEVEEKIAVNEIIKDEEITEEEFEVVLEEEFELEEKKQAIAETSEEESNKNEFHPAFELDEDDEENQEEAPKEKEELQISFFDLLGDDYREATFVKVDSSEELSSENDVDIPAAYFFEEEKTEISIEENTENSELRSVSLNDKLSKGINIDLNDRIAFVKHLFGNSDEDYNRVLNQLITYDSFDEAQDFIEDMVKPDYNSWEGKEDYAQRFIEIIEKKFA
ncbi:hypothetical protein [uncultured Flavobacterium sp.]|jgi:hypothetical protein|uniref:hypothetical protein n=1 Tax=uncultured Flavobacterium sp. TaxID=165435 RepID=UPI0030CA3D13